MSARAMSVASQLAEVLERVSQAAVRCQQAPSVVSHRTKLSDGRGQCMEAIPSQIH